MKAVGRIAIALCCLAAAPLAADGIVWSLWQQRLMRFADRVALGAAEAVQEGEDPVAWAESQLQRWEISGTVAHPPRTGRHRGDPDAVRVEVETERAPPLTGFLLGERRLRASATAAFVTDPEDARSPTVARVE